MSENQHKLPLEMFYHWEKEQPNKIYLRQAIKGKWHEYSWQKVGHEVRTIAKFLNDQGLKDGAKVAIFSKNCAHWFMADLAIMMAGCVSVPLYPADQVDTCRYIFEHSEARLVFVGKFDDWRKMEASIPAGIKRVTFPYPSSMPADYEWDKLVAEGEALRDSPVYPAMQAATIIYTSGTTGRPKGALHTFNGLAFAGHNFSKAVNFGPNERFFSYLPLAHVAERSLVEMCSLYVAAEVAFAQSMETFIDNLKDVSPTAFFSVPRLWAKFRERILQKIPQKRLKLLLAIPLVSALIKRKIQTGLGLDQAKAIGSGAAPISREILEWYAKLGINIMEGYGQTENLAYGSINLGTKMPFGTVGKALPGCAIKIDDNGEILVKNDAVMLEYYLNPEETAAVFKDGYIKTGDVGEFDDQGALKVTGRLKELFKTEKGKYVSPSAIENKLRSNEIIDQLCVTGSGMPQPVALLVLSDVARQKDRKKVNQDVSTVLDGLNQSLSSHEKVRQCIVVKGPWTVDNGLMTPTLKVKRHVVEQKYQPLLERVKGDKTAVIWE